jgi:hypothetical protein
MMRSRSGTVRWIDAQHHWERLDEEGLVAPDATLWRDRTRALQRAQR